jgi:hypothetical protein
LASLFSLAKCTKTVSPSFSQVMRHRTKCS